MKKLLLASAAAAALSLAMPAMANDATDTVTITETKRTPTIVRIDLRTHPEERLHSITLSAESRDAARTLPEDLGHAFITFNSENEQKAMTTNEVVGFYPPDREEKSLWRAMFGFNEGGLKNDALETADYQVIIAVNSDQYERALAIYEKYKKPQNYFLTLQDCTTFAGEVARAIGLQTPTRLLAPYPDGYIKEILRLKQDSDAAKEKEKAEKLKQEEQRKLDQQRAAAAALMVMQQQRAAAEAAAAQQAAAARQAAEAARQQQAAQQAATAAEAARQMAAQRAAAEKAAADAAATRQAELSRMIQAQQEQMLASQRAQQAAADAARAAQMAPKYPYNSGPIGGGSAGYAGPGAGMGGPAIGPMR